MLYTVFTTKEYPPEFYESDENEESIGYVQGLKIAFNNMPKSFVKFVLLKQ